MKSEARPYNTPYTGDYLNRVAFPLGGIGAGMICLEGTGFLSHASLRGHPEVFNELPAFSALCIKGQPNLAVALEGWVHESIRNKNFTQALATAADVAQSLEGDCTEHAVLLAALCRARKLPARVAVGLVYSPADQGFAFHMWNQVWIKDRWIPLDATLGLGGIGAAHLTLAVSDLTVENADEVKDFYSQVVGWQADLVDMGGYHDFNMCSPETDTPAAGICYARGVNADLPAQWLIYIVVADLDASIARCRDLGGEIVAGPKQLGERARYCVIQDPAGAVAALYAPGE